MRRLVTALTALIFAACSGPTGPTGNAYTYTSSIDGERVTGTISLSNNPGFHVRGSYHIDGEDGEIDGAITGREIHFLLIDFRGDTLRHVAERGDILRGTWERGTTVDGSWRAADNTGTFRAVHQ